jgi:VWFA-related protein
VPERQTHARAARLAPLLAAASLLCGAVGRAQVEEHTRPRLAVTTTTQVPQAVGDDEVVKIDASEVLIPVTVRDRGGRLVTALKVSDFRLWEDGSEQTLSNLSLRRVPVDVALLVDASSSVAANLGDFRRAAEGFAARLGAEDRFCLLKFDDRVELLLDWTSSVAQLRRALNRLEGGTFTRYNDALYLTAREQFRDARRRHAVVVLTDGIDSGRGGVTQERALAELFRSQAAVYAVANTRIERAKKNEELERLLAGDAAGRWFNGLRAEDLRDSLRALEDGELQLERQAEATGGRVYTPESFDDLDSVYAEVAEELRSQYALYYTPSNPATDGSFRRVRVAAREPGYKVSARAGYFAPRR